MSALNLIDEILTDHDKILNVEQNDIKGINFNGIGEEEHESFIVDYGRPYEFEFCKTARKPYDIAVCKCLLVLSLSKGFGFSSDGDVKTGEENWGEAIKWFVKKGYGDTLTKKVYPSLKS